MKVSKEFAAYVKEYTNNVLSDEEIAQIADNFDDEMVRTGLTEAYTIERWDRKSDINGVPADEVLEARDDIPEDGIVYLIKLHGRIQYFQPHAAGQEGHTVLTEENWEQLATEHRDQIVQDAIYGEFLQQVNGAARDKVKG